MWTFSTDVGFLGRNGNYVGKGYSGRGEGLLNPLMESAVDVGPIPRGSYWIGPWHDDPKLGPVVAELIPHSENEMFGRSGFFIHGDNPQMNFTASDGCIILSRELREQIRDSGDDQLGVDGAVEQERPSAVA